MTPSDASLQSAAQAQLHQHNDRAAGLNDHEIDALAERIWTRLEYRFENIGWNTSTHDSREEIRADNKWVREWRTSADRAKTVAYGAGIVAFVAGLLALMWKTFVAAVTKAGA